MNEWLPKSKNIPPYEPTAPKKDEKRVVRVAELDTIELASRELARAVERVKAVHWTLVELGEVDRICDEFDNLTEHLLEGGLWYTDTEVKALVERIREAIR